MWIVRPLALVVLLAPAPVGRPKPSVETIRLLTPDLSARDSAVRARAERELLELGPSAIAPLLEIYVNRGGAEGKAIYELLPKYGPDAIDAFEEAGYRDYTGQGPRLMWEAAAHAVVRMGDPALPVIVAGFKDPSGGCFLLCGRALAIMQEEDRRATAILIPFLDSPHAEVRETTVGLLANFPDRRAYDALLAGLKSGDSTVRMYAALGLRRLGNRSAIPYLIGNLDDPMMGVREAAVAALGQMYEPRFRGPLGAIARTDPETSVRNTAAVWLLRSGDPLAARLGRRYKPISIDPARKGWIRLRYWMRLGVTFVLVSVGVLISIVLSSRRRGVTRWAAMMLSASVLGTSGFVWGGVVVNVAAVVEYALLCAVVPASAIAVYLASAVTRLDCRWIGLVANFGAFYAGYAFGWLWLWGRLGI